MKKKVELRKIRDFGEIINDTFVFIGQNWKPLLRSYVVICGFFVLASLAFSIMNQLKISSAFTMTDAPFRVSNSPFRWFGLEYVLAMVFMLLSYTSVYLTTLCYIALYNAKGNQPPTVEEVWSYFKFYIFRVMGSGVLLTIGLGISILLCVIPFFYFWPVFSLVIPIIVFENTTLGYAFNRAFQLIKNNFWSTLGVLVVAAIIVYVAMMIFVVPLSIFNISSLLAAGHKFNTTVLVLTAVAQHICQAFYMMPAIALALCYFSLTEQKDNTGLLDRINSLGSTEPPVSDQFPSEEY